MPDRNWADKVPIYHKQEPSCITLSTTSNILENCGVSISIRWNLTLVYIYFLRRLHKHKINFRVLGIGIPSDADCVGTRIYYLELFTISCKYLKYVQCYIFICLYISWLTINIINFMYIILIIISNISWQWYDFN